jgi:hypothetical protein
MVQGGSVSQDQQVLRPRRICVVLLQRFRRGEFAFHLPAWLVTALLPAIFSIEVMIPAFSEGQVAANEARKQATPADFEMQTKRAAYRAQSIIGSMHSGLC